ncbi:MAG: formate/nitrite transporter family protein, partial [Clostridia bacterium]|nr:formate/nitrite transporter family protein [Clostridia bacterium]
DGLSRLAGGITFSVGLIMVILAGAELFTGNNLVMALGLYDRRITWQALLRNWTLVYLANFLGALLLVAIFYATNLWLANGAMVGAKAVLTAQAKVNLTFSEAFFRGILCNWLVCLAVWLANAGKDAVSKILGIMLPVAAFVTSGFEHSIANMYFIPIGILLSDQVQVAGALVRLGQDPVAVGAALTWIKFLVANLIPVTLGNIVGGAIFVGGSYWAVYLHRPAAPKVKAAPETKAAPAAAPATGGRMLSATGRGGKV